ncbi:MAG TPA: carboxypeptidase-like regulatory domain-containing protein, partial [Candidatus Acidoferrum sp.]|nr:carboxypeptidase-like regulatory domain-containing protein [Candidatus Acidoferrum sp.]
MMKRRLFTAILVAPLCVGGTQAQTSKKDAVTIEGIVLGADGKPVPAAAVTCQSSAGMKPRAVHTDAKGHYVITGLKQDSYDIRASSNGA